MVMSFFRRALLALAFVVPTALVAAPGSAAAAPRHYDCSKPGNANKSACKGALMPTTPAVRKTTTAVTTTTTTRHYDCSKPGNSSKAPCKTAAAQASAGKSAGAVKTTTTSTATTKDCTKWYNRMRATCRTSTASTPAHTTVAPAPKPVQPATAARSNANPTKAANSDPAGATAQCRDGTYSHSRTHQGACSHHGGVAKWL